jgi:hypothetical protein
MVFFGFKGTDFARFLRRFCRYTAPFFFGFGDIAGLTPFLLQ